MTGYGQARWQGEGCAILAEVRSVNGRHLKLNTRVPHEMVGAEHDLEKVVRRYVTRGSLELYVRVERTGAQAARPIRPLPRRRHTSPTAMASSTISILRAAKSWTAKASLTAMPVE